MGPDAGPTPGSISCDGDVKKHLEIVAAGDDLFTEAAIQALHNVARGIPRVINRIATDALTLVALDHRTSVTEDDIYNASKAI